MQILSMSGYVWISWKKNIEKVRKWVKGDAIIGVTPTTDIPESNCPVWGWFFRYWNKTDTLRM